MGFAPKAPELGGAVAGGQPAPTLVSLKSGPGGGDYRNPGLCANP
jgi:hypothetical protein